MEKNDGSSKFICNWIYHPVQLLIAALFPIRQRLSQWPRSLNGGEPPPEFLWNRTTFTLDPNQDFVITMLTSSSSSCTPKIDGTAVYAGSYTSNPFYYSINYASHNGGFSQGRAHLVIPAGSTLTMSNCDHYYMDGFYAHP